MTPHFSAATVAYGNAQLLVTQGLNATAEPAAGTGQGFDFAKLLADSMQSVVDTGKASDQKMLDMVNGKADVVDVVTAVSQTEIAIESMVAVRDRVITADEEIMRMPI